MRYVILLSIGVGSLDGLVGCEREPANVNQPSDCPAVAEGVYVNQRYPNSLEPYHPDSATVFTFENGFSDTVSVWVGNIRLTEQYMETKSNGLAGNVKIKPLPNDVVTLRTAGGSCARFRLRGGYRYLYVNKSAANWSVAYSNYNRGYF